MMNDYLITEAYGNYRNAVFRYFSSRINREEDAEDLAQDVFLRLMEQPDFVQESTLCSLVFTIAHNLLMDYLRRHYKWQEVASHIKDAAAWTTNETESRVVANDLRRQEGLCLEKMPELRKNVYRMVRYEGKTATEISAELDMPVKAVCDQLYLGRKAVRTYMKECI